jgi:hypothetical protein
MKLTTLKTPFKKISAIIVLSLIILTSVFFIFLNRETLGIGGQAANTFPPIDPAKSFSVVVLPDTQNYSAEYPEIFCEQTQWIVDHKKELNIVFVSHMGDLVNNGGEKPEQWETASRCMGKLDGVVPYSVIPGNHDSDTPHRKSSGFSAYDKYFPATKFSDNIWYGGDFQNNRNNFEIINAGGIPMLFLNLEIEPSDKALDWARTVVAKHPDAYTILTTHKFLPVYLRVRDIALGFSADGNTGESIWEKLIFGNCSIAMTWSGHYHGENRISSKDSCGKDVNQVLQDYQDRPNGGEGWLRVYVFSPEKKNIQVYTYSPFLGKMETDRDSRFTLPFVLPSAPFAPTAGSGLKL